MKRLAIFASYSDGNVPPWIEFHLRALRNRSARLVYVSNSVLSDASRIRLHAICNAVIERDNAGYDFAAWRDAILAENMDRWDEVLLTNSSIVGPLFDLAPLFERMRGRGCDFWGLTHSINVRPHIQSYFMCFGGDVIRAPVWSGFWRSVRDETSKRRVISDYETNLAHILQSAGFAGDTLIPQMRKSGLERLFFRRLNTRLPVYIPFDKNRTNPTIHSPLELIEQGMPYLKASLLWGHNRRQPFPLQEIRKLKQVDYDWSLVGL